MEEDFSWFKVDPELYERLPSNEDIPVKCEMLKMIREGLELPDIYVLLQNKGHSLLQIRRIHTQIIQGHDLDSPKKKRKLLKDALRNIR